MARRYRDPDWLERKYATEELTQREIAEECGVSVRTIRKYMKRFDIMVRETVGKNHPLYGTERSEETKAKISATLQGRMVTDETRRLISESQEGQVLPTETRARISEALTGRTKSRCTRKKMSQSTAGENNPNWRGGYSNRYGAGWTLARERVRERDQVCYCGHDGSQDTLAVHHMVPVRRFRETSILTLEDAHREENLVLLCNRCHGRAEHGQIEVG